MSNQRSILSFFASPSSGPPKPLQPRQPYSQQQTVQRAAQQPPLPPPPASAARFVPPPPRNGGPALVPRPPPGMTVRMGGSPTPDPDLPPISAECSRSILLEAGAQDVDGELFFGGSRSSSDSDGRVVFPRDAHVPDLVSVNAILLPVRYADSFYRRVTDRTHLASLFNRVILNDAGKVVGGVVCRLESSPFTNDAGSDDAAGSPQNAQYTPKSGPLAVYVQSLALLSPYRGRGLMAAALESIVAAARVLNASDSSGALRLQLPLQMPPIAALYAHVWTESDDALAWYAARGFARQGAEPLAHYYFALRPDTAWVVRRDVLAGAESRTTTPNKVLSALQASNEPAAAAAAALPPPPKATNMATSSQSQSYQNARPETEWNDLPEDMVTASASASATGSLASSRTTSRNVSRMSLAEAGEGVGRRTLLVPPLPQTEDGDGAAGSPATASSRSSSTGRKKRERAYPAAMFQ